MSTIDRGRTRLGRLSVRFMTLSALLFALHATAQTKVFPADPPASPSAAAPNLVSGRDGGVWLSWLEPDGEQDVLKVAHFVDGQWQAPREVARGSQLVVNRSDVPELAVAEDGTLFAHWLEELGGDGHAYGARMVKSTDGGSSWSPLGWLHDDLSPVEHGFVSFVPAESGAIEAYWLDGRAHPTGGATALRTAAVHSEGSPPSSVLDERVCECCSTDAARTADGPLVVYRDRSADEIRDISVVRRSADGWSAPQSIHSDGWQIEGCPVNGPAVAASGRSVAVAWFTAAAADARVLIALSDDAGASFAEPLVVDENGPRGQVDVTLTQRGAVITWLRRAEKTTQVAWRLVGSDGALGPVGIAGPSEGARVSGYPRVESIDDGALLVWVETAEEARVRGAVLRFDEAASER